MGECQEDDHATATGNEWLLGRAADVADGTQRPGPIADVRARAERKLEELPMQAKQAAVVEAVETIIENEQYMSRDFTEIVTGDERIGDQLDQQAAWREAANEHGSVEGPRRVELERHCQRQERQRRIDEGTPPTTHNPFAAPPPAPTLPAPEPTPAAPEPESAA